MATPDFDNVAGYLCRLGDETDVRALFAARPGVGNWQVLVADSWYSFEWQTPGGMHKFLLRDGNDRFMLMTDDHTHVNSFFEICGIDNRIERPRVAISTFVKDLVSPVNDPDSERPGRAYRVSSVFASIDGYGRSLKTIALWGDDLINAALFTELLGQITPYRATVREVSRDGDILSAGGGGEVNFLYRGPTHLKKVDSFFRYLKRQGFIRWTWGNRPEVPSD